MPYDSPFLLQKIRLENKYAKYTSNYRFRISLAVLEMLRIPTLHFHHF